MTGPKREYPQFKFDSFNLENGLEARSGAARGAVRHVQTALKMRESRAARRFNTS
jgi:hypothetical protein